MSFEQATLLVKLNVGVNIFICCGFQTLLVFKYNPAFCDQFLMIIHIFAFNYISTSNKSIITLSNILVLSYIRLSNNNNCRVQYRNILLA